MCLCERLACVCMCVFMHVCMYVCASGRGDECSDCLIHVHASLKSDTRTHTHSHRRDGKGSMIYLKIAWMDASAAMLSLQVTSRVNSSWKNR